MMSVLPTSFKVSDLLYRSRRSLNPLVSQIAMNGFKTSLSQIEKPVFKVSRSYVQDCPGHKIKFSLQLNLWGNLEQWWRAIALSKSHRKYKEIMDKSDINSSNR